MQQLTLSQVSLQKQPSSITEMYIPLWVMSSNTAMSGGYYSAGSVFVQKGTQSITTSSSTVSAKLHTLNPNWSPNQKFAFEASFCNNTSGQTAYVALWDMTSNSIVSSSQLSFTGTTYTLVRSGQFTLIPGHAYGITLWVSASSQCYLTKAHLVAFLS